MRRIANTENKNAFVFQGSSEIVMGYHIACCYSDNETLRGKIETLWDDVAEGQALPEQEQFVADDADVILDVLLHIAIYGKDAWRQAQADCMLDQYEGTRPLQPVPHEPAVAELPDLALPLRELEDDIALFERTGRLV